MPPLQLGSLQPGVLQVFFFRFASGSAVDSADVQLPTPRLPGHSADLHRLQEGGFLVDVVDGADSTGVNGDGSGN